MKKIFKVTLCIFVFFIIVLGVLGYTKTGLVVIQKTINKFASSVVSIDQVEGRLLGDWALKGLVVTTPGIDISLEDISCSWQPERFFLGELHIVALKARKLVIKLKLEENLSEQAAEDSNPGGVELPVFTLPMAIFLKRFSLEEMFVTDSDGTAYKIIEKAGASFDGSGRRLSISDFSVSGPDYGLAMHGTLDVNNNWKLDLMGSWNLVGFGFHKLIGTFSLAGPLESPDVHFGVQEPGDIQVVGKVKNLLKNPVWRGNLEARDLDLSALIVDCPKIDLQSVHGNITGDTKGYGGHVEALGNYDTLKGMKLVSDIRADWMGIVFKTFRIDRDDTNVEIEDGNISWNEIFEWEAHLVVKNLDPSIIDDTLQGKLNSNFYSKGEVKENGVVAAFNIDSLDGVFHEHSVRLRGNVFLTEDDVSSDGLTLNSSEMEGSVHMRQGKFSWAEELSWSADVRVEDFNSAWLHPGFYGQVNGHFVGEGIFRESGPELYVNLTEISGDLLGNDLSGGGELELRDNVFQTTGLVLKSGVSELGLKGRASDALALDFTFRSPDIGHLLPESTGKLSIDGSFKGSRIKPEIDVALHGSGLSYLENSIAQVQIELHSELQSDGALTGSGRAEKMVLAGFEFDESRININGTQAEHAISLSLAKATEKLQLKAKGGYHKLWEGELFDLTLDSLNYGLWRQSGGAPIAVSRSEISLGAFCLTEESGKVCLETTVLLADKNEWKVASSLQSLPLSLLNRWKLFSVPVKGQLSGNLSAEGNKQGVSKAEVDIQLPKTDFDIDSEFEDLDPIRINDTVVTLDLADNLLQGLLASEMENGSKLRLSTQIAGVGLFTAPMDQMMLDGLLELEDFNLGLLALFTNFNVEPTGKINSELTLGGTLSQPKIYGQAHLEGGGIALPFQGITLKDVTLSLDAEEGGAHVKSQASSGEGHLKADGILRYGNKGIEGDLQLQGDNFKLFDLPEYVINISPDVRFSFSQEKGTLEGAVTIPYGLITPEAMRDTVSVSEDVIFVDGDEEVKDGSWPVSVALDVHLGEDVRIDGYGLTGKLEGGIGVKKIPNEIMTGTGELDLVDGSFAIYSRLLDIERGRVLFTSGPIDNPGVDVRAQKKISEQQAKGEGYTVGVEISGLVQDLEFHLFSEPYMEDADILSHLVVGHSMASSSEAEGNILTSAAVALGLKGSSSFMQGLGNILQVDDFHIEGSEKEEDFSLVVGKRVGKDLYIGYDVNMFSQLGQFRVRYDLSKGFSVETSSSAESTGADFLYSFEK